jgi:hypothetical protein
MPTLHQAITEGPRPGDIYWTLAADRGKSIVMAAILSSNCLSVRDPIIGKTPLDLTQAVATWPGVCPNPAAIPSIASRTAAYLLFCASAISGDITVIRPSPPFRYLDVRIPTAMGEYPITKVILN